MNASLQNTFGRKLGSEAVEQRLTEIALLMHNAFPHCMWDREPRQNRRPIDRLIVEVAGRGTPLVFTDRELVSYSRRKRRVAIDHRMHDALSKLFDE